MERTPEQVAADDTLTAAIEQVWSAYYPDSEPGVLLEYVVAARRRSFDDEGEPLTANAIMPRDGDVPVDFMLGLTEYVTTRLRKRIAED